MLKHMAYVLEDQIHFPWFFLLSFFDNFQWNMTTYSKWPWPWPPSPVTWAFNLQYNRALKFWVINDYLLFLPVVIYHIELPVMVSDRVGLTWNSNFNKYKRMEKNLNKPNYIVGWYLCGIITVIQWCYRKFFAAEFILWVLIFSFRFNRFGYNSQYNRI